MKYLTGFTDVFIDPITGKNINGNGSSDTHDATFVVRTNDVRLPNAVVLEDFVNGIIRKGEDGYISTSTKIKIEELPELFGTTTVGVFGGDIFRGTVNGKVERSSALTNVITDLSVTNASLITTNTRLAMAPFIMSAKPSDWTSWMWHKSQFLSDLKTPAPYPNDPTGIVQYDRKFNKVEYAKPHVDYLIPDMRENNRIWMSKHPHDRGSEIEEIEPPWLQATYITQKVDESSPNSQALNQLGVNINDVGLIKVDTEGVIHKAGLSYNKVWCGDKNNLPVEIDFKGSNNKAKYIVKEPDESLPNAIALSELQIPYPSLVSIDENGLIERARLGHGFMWRGGENGYPELVELKTPNSDVKFIVQQSDSSVPNAQALSNLGTSMIKVVSGGIIEKAVADVDYATKETLEELKEQAKVSAEEAATSAEEATAAATEATGAAGEATTAAGEATGSATTASAAALGAGLSATAAGLSSSSASSSSSSASNSASEASQSAEKAKKYSDEIEEVGITFVGDVEGNGKLNEDIEVKIKDNPIFRGNECIVLPVGTIEQRPENPVIGMLRLNKNEIDSYGMLEYYNGKVWLKLQSELIRI